MSCVIRVRNESAVGMGPVVFAVIFAVVLAAGSAGATEYGDFSVDARLRYETAEIEGSEDADAATLRLRLGYATPAWKGLSGMVEGEFTGVADKDSYNAAGVHGDPDKAVIADPESAGLDQLYLKYVHDIGNGVVGRQRIVLDNARFVGDVAWRQNRQTYDAASVQYTGTENLQVFYGYVANVVRIFGSEAPDTGSNASEAESDSHLANASYLLPGDMKLALYGYFLDQDDVPPTSSADSVGGSVTGKLTPADAFGLGYRAEYARQQDAGDNPKDYEADYYHLALDAVYQGFLADFGYEVLGAEKTSALDEDGAPIYGSFQTPLATLHKFNGFADRFLTTPDEGLEDAYVAVGYQLPINENVGPVLGKVIYHDFSAAEGSDDLGDEWDVLLALPMKTDAVPGTFKALAKYANYAKGDVGSDTERFIIELNYGLVF